MHTYNPRAGGAETGRFLGWLASQSSLMAELQVPERDPEIPSSGLTLAHIRTCTRVLAQTKSSTPAMESTL